MSVSPLPATPAGARPTPAGPDPEIDLELVRLTRRYGPITAVAEVSLAIRQGEFLTLLGPSGCGKTTLLKTVAGFLAPTSGEVILRSEVINDVLPHQRDIGLVFQNYALFPHMTVAGNVAFGLQMRRAPRALIRRRVEEVLALVKLPGFEGRYPHQLSGGQQQRVALARVLAVQPILLLLDEPFGALDKKLRVEMQIELKQLITALRITTVFVTHDQEEAMRMSDRIAVMNQGRIVQCGTPAAIYDLPADLFVADFIGASNLVRAKVGSAAGEAWSVEVEGVCLAVPRPATPWPARPEGSEGLVMIRPENLVLSAGPPPDRPAWHGGGPFAIHAGATMEYEVALGDGPRLRISEPRAKAGGARAWQVGERLVVSVVDPAACRLFLDEPR